MTERKVLNKYFPPDYDPSKIPRLKRGNRSRQFNIRTMAPFNMRCLTCNGYVYKAKKFNSRMEVAEGVNFLGLRHYRFYIRCPTCCAEIIWRTDLESNDYVIESGAKRNFEALKTAEELEAKKAALEEEEHANNPMKLLEKRTNQSKNEMETAEALDDLKELNKRQSTMETDTYLLKNLWKEIEADKNAQEQADEEFIKEIMNAKHKGIPVPEFNLDDHKPSNSNSEKPISRTISNSVTIIKNTNSVSLRNQIKQAIVKKRPSTNALDITAEPNPKKSGFKDPEVAISTKKCNPLGLAYSDNSDSN